MRQFIEKYFFNIFRRKHPYKDDDYFSIVPRTVDGTVYDARGRIVKGFDPDSRDKFNAIRNGVKKPRHRVMRISSSNGGSIWVMSDGTSINMTGAKKSSQAESA